VDRPDRLEPLEHLGHLGLLVLSVSQERREIMDRLERRVRRARQDFKELWVIGEHRGPVVGQDLPGRKDRPGRLGLGDLKGHLEDQVLLVKMGLREQLALLVQLVSLDQPVSRDQRGRKDRQEISVAQDLRGLRDNPALRAYLDRMANLVHPELTVSQGLGVHKDPVVLLVCQEIRVQQGIQVKLAHLGPKELSVTKEPLELPEQMDSPAMRDRMVNQAQQGRQGALV